MHFCEVCNKPTVHIRMASPVVAHLILAIITLGLWLLFVTIPVEIYRQSFADCSLCGTRARRWLGIGR